MVRVLLFNTYIVSYFDMLTISNLGGYSKGSRMSFDVCVVGLGYIGLPTASVIAESGARVLGVDISDKVVETIGAGNIHIVEPELDVIVKSVVERGALVARTVPDTAKVYIIAVPTPINADRSPSLKYVEQAAESISSLLQPGVLVILESTCPVGTTEKIESLLSSIRPDLTFPSQSDQSDVSIAYCPERVLPGKVLEELVQNDRIIGGLNSKSSIDAADFYRTFVAGEIHTTTSRTAELAKLAENAYRDVNIAFANELSIICDELSIDAYNLIALANKHPRVNILSPGPGVGGHCIAVDPWFIVDSCPQSAKLIRVAREVNGYKPEFVIGKIRQEVEKLVLGSTDGKPVTIALLGLAFKPDVDDLRGSPSLYIAESLIGIPNVEIILVEPNIDVLPKTLVYSNTSLANLSFALESADLWVALVKHREFLDVDMGCVDTKGLDFVNILS